ncbi:unnamed protein product, partial [Medioppia subpectinata]
MSIITDKIEHQTDYNLSFLELKHTLNLKIRGAVEVNESADNFDQNYVKPKEFVNYNRVWDAKDYAHYYPREVYVMTNMAITANQTLTVCPDHPRVNKALCKPGDKTHCRYGRQTPFGVQTGKCVPADFPTQKNTSGSIVWDYEHTCEIRGWCPVDRILPPLKNDRPVLGSTNTSTLWIKNSVVFPDRG